jgi:pyridoxal phosphate enzyme (YggS family)
MNAGATVEARLPLVEKEIESACGRCGRNPQSVTIVAAAKAQSVEAINAFISIQNARGKVAVIGENYLQEFEKKKPALRGNFSAHCIGSLQSNKAKSAVQLFDCVETLHTAKLAGLLDREAEARDATLDVFLQVNVSGDAAKHGLAPAAVAAFLAAEEPCWTRLRLKGLMAITKLYERPEDVRPDFRVLRELRDEIVGTTGKTELALSMGMSQDYHIAVEEGATHVRIGTALFGTRG